MLIFKMPLTGLHFLLTLQCNRECDHCFVWGSPWQKGVMTLEGIRGFLGQAKDAGGIAEVWLEGGEPFLYYPLLVEGAKQATSLGFRVGVVSNAYWAESREDALYWLKPLAGSVATLLVSCDPIHWSADAARRAEIATAAAQEASIGLGVMAITPKDEGTIPGVMYRGRAAVKLAPKAGTAPWETFTKCPFENLRDPARMHLDPFGNLHACQGLVVGNLLREPLSSILARWNPDAHPVLGPLLAGGPAELARRLGPPAGPMFADACHLCYETRRAARGRLPEVLAPDGMYGG